MKIEGSIEGGVDEMARLTKVIKPPLEQVIVYTKGKYENTTAGEMENEDVRKVLKRLAAYEDTGLMPEEVMELKERDTAKKVKRTEYGVPKCPNCESIYVYYYEEDMEYDFCTECGQRIKWEK